ncbi:MAG TPA: TIGR03435 family protein [Acidobacteriaceae bacterium]|jgi:uncharacterized protein (TIGR03435 family)|nr:TIGR03435 family protein [Acidobacteriaceae bacterium]
MAQIAGFPALTRSVPCLLLLLSAAIFGAAATSADAQAPGTPRPAANQFEVATIKPVDPHGILTMGAEVDPAGRVSLNAMSLKTMVQVAFNVSYWQIAGGELWTDKTLYNLVAEPPEEIRQSHPDTRHGWYTIADPRLREMLQALLIDRFQLQVHRESRIGNVDWLERTSRPLLLRPTKAPEPSTDAPPVGFGSIGFAGKTWVLHNTTIPQLAEFASSYMLHRPVLDRTGLSGAFDDRSTPEDWNTYNADQFGSFLHLMSEIGLKLEPAKGPVETLVIDHAAPPSPN